MRGGYPKFLPRVIKKQMRLSVEEDPKPLGVRRHLSSTINKFFLIESINSSSSFPSFRPSTEVSGVSLLIS